MSDIYTKQEVIDKLRSHGCRITNQRKILIDILLQHHCDSCKEIYYLALKKDSSIGIATVYRMIRILEEYEMLRRRSMYRIHI